MRIACVWVPHFSAAALLRSDPALRERPVALVRGSAPATTVVDVTAAASEAGIRAGMSEGEARARCPALIVRPMSSERDEAAQQTLLAVVIETSPRVEDAAPGLVYVDIDGLASLFGGDRDIALRLGHHARSIGLPACVGVAEGRLAARSAARLGRPITVLKAGEELETLASAPLSVLDLEPGLHDVLMRWGVGTVGELAQLPRSGLAERLGDTGLRAHDLALGIDRSPFQRHVPPPFYEEAQGVDWEIVSLEHLLPVVRVVLERLTQRLARLQLAADQLSLTLGLANGAHDQRVIDVAYPIVEADPLLVLIRLDIEREPPPAAVVRVALGARPVRVAPEQRGLWRPLAPAARDLTNALTRLTLLVGAGNVGSPTLVDSYRPDAISMRPFRPGQPHDDPVPHEASGARASALTGDDLIHAVLALRRFRPALAATVDTRRERPVHVEAERFGGDVVTCAGPWRSSGEWWTETPWSRLEWDVVLSDHTLCRLALDELGARWVIEGVYD